MLNLSFIECHSHYHSETDTTNSPSDPLAAAADTKYITSWAGGTIL